MSFLFGDSGPYTERHLVLLGEWSPWLQAAVIAIALTVLGLSIYNYRELRPLRRRVGLITLRALIVATLVGVFYQPAFLEQNVATSKNHVAVLLDVSESMGLDHGEQTRLGLARDFLRDNADLFERLAETNTLSFFSFGGEVREHTDAAALSALKASEPRTWLVAALEDLRARYLNRDLGGVLVLTDGIDTSEAGRRAGLDRRAEQLVAALDAPILSFTTAGGAALKDVAVEEVSYNNFAFLMNATSLDAMVRVHGYPYGSVEVRLTENGREVARQRIDLRPSQDAYPVTFEFVPRTLGKQVYGVTADHLADEIYAQNNSRQVIINVIRDKIRVLQIVGQPSWDERFLRNLLKQDPNVDLISFFILVNTQNFRPVGQGETALIPFPAKELFEDELGGFDLAIFQNFNYGPFRTREYLPRVAQFVRDGGAFLMIGGPLSFSAGRYYGTPITEILPVDLEPSFAKPWEAAQGAADPTIDTSNFKPRLSAAGEHHPVTRLALDPAINAAAWGQLEPLEGINRAKRAKSDALTLVEHPSLRDASGAPAPVVAVRDVGKGRSMAVMTDSTWHWSFKAANKGGDPRHYDTFWKNSLRWLVKDPELDLVRVRVVRESVPLGETATVRVEVYRPDYRPAAKEAVELIVRRRGPGDGPGEGAEVLRDTERVTDAAGHITLEVPVPQAGVYEVEARARVVPQRVAKGNALFVGSDLNPEFERIVGDTRLLDALAQASGGDVFPIDVVNPALTLRQPRVSKVESRRHRELWNVPFVLVLLAGLMGLEWWLRRRFGYL